MGFELRPIMFGDIVFDDYRLPRWRVLAEDRGTGERRIVTVDPYEPVEKKSHFWWPVLWGGERKTLRYTSDYNSERQVSLDINNRTTRVIEACDLSKVLMAPAQCAVEPSVEAFPHAGFVIMSTECRGFQIDVVVPCTALLLDYYLRALRSIVDGSFVSPFLPDDAIWEKFGARDSTHQAHASKFINVGESEQKAYPATALQFIATLLRYGTAQLFVRPPVSGKTLASVSGLVFSNGVSRRQYVADHVKFQPYPERWIERGPSFYLFVDGEPFKPIPSREEVIELAMQDVNYSGDLRELHRKCIDLQLPEAPSIGLFDKTGYHVPCEDARITLS